MDRFPCQPANTRWAVRILFADGEYETAAWASTEQRAFQLALVDARMANPLGTFLGKVLGWAAAPLGEEVAA